VSQSDWRRFERVSAGPPHWFGEMVLGLVILLAAVFTLYVLVTGGRL